MDENERWMLRALCATESIPTDLFFPERGTSPKEAKQVCWRCPVREDCLEYALVNHITTGTWGGHSERDRRKLRQVRHREGKRCVDCGAHIPWREGVSVLPSRCPPHRLEHDAKLRRKAEAKRKRDRLQFKVVTS